MLSRLVTAAAAIATLATAVPATAQSAADEQRFRQAQQRFDSEYQRYRSETDHYQSRRGQTGYYNNNYNPSGGTAYANDEQYDPNYDASRYYRPSNSERVLANDDRVYAGQDGRYYCKRSDGTTGLIVGAAGGGILGNVIDGGRSRSVGTLLGAALGGLAGRAVQKNQSEIRCR